MSIGISGVQLQVSKAAYTVIMYKVGSYSVITDSAGRKIANTTVGATALTAALAAIDDAGGGKLYGFGVHEIASDVALPSKDWYSLEGDCLPSNEYDIVNSGGFVLDFTGGAALVDGKDSWEYYLSLKNMALKFSGTYATPAIWLDYTYVKIDNVMLEAACDHSCAHLWQIGSVGPPGEESTWHNLYIIDRRDGDADKWLLLLYAESIDISGLFWLADLQATYNARGIKFHAVCYVKLSGLVIYTTGIGGFDDNNRVYSYQFGTSAGAGIQRWNFERVQFFEAADISVSHIVTDGTQVLVLTGKLLLEMEGTTTLVNPSDSGGGTLKRQLSGEGWEHHSVQTGNGGEQTIPHGLAGALVPNIVKLGPPSANPVQSSPADAANVYITADNGEDYTIEARFWEN